MPDDPREAAQDGLRALGAFIKQQRTLSEMTLRQLSELTDVSNPYLSQLERGLHEPSVRVLTAIAKALNVSAATLLSQAGLITDDDIAAAQLMPDTESAIKADTRLSDDQKTALLAVYRSYAAD